MICNDCKYEQCPACEGAGKGPIQGRCVACEGEGQLAKGQKSHLECVKRNKGKEVADCDCQHKLNRAGSRS